jgi:hypothetical protein
VRVVVEFLGVRLMLVHQFEGDRESARHVLIIGLLLVVAVQLIVDGTGLEYLRLQCNADGNFFFFAHGHQLHLADRRGLTLRKVVLPATRRRDGRHPTTLSARRQALACGAGCGGS